MIKKFLLSGNSDVAILTLRIFTGVLMIAGHGWGKITKFETRFHTFSDPLGVGNEISYILAVTAEFVCSLLIIFGLFTRIAVIPPAITMIVAAFVVHGDDPWNKKEMAILYFIAYIVMLICGPGKYSVDKKVFSR